MESIGHWPVISLRKACQFSLIGPLSAAELTWLKRTVGYCLNSLWLLNKSTNSNPFANNDSTNTSPCQEPSPSSFIYFLLFSIWLLHDIPHAILLSFEMCFNRPIVISLSEDVWKTHMSPDVTNYYGLHIRLSFPSYISVWQVSAHHFVCVCVCFLNSTIYKNNNNNKANLFNYSYCCTNIWFRYISLLLLFN